MIFNIRELTISNYIVYNDTSPNTILFDPIFNNNPPDIVTEFGPQNEESTDTIKYSISIENTNRNIIDDILFETLCDTSSKIIRSNNSIYNLLQNIKPITFAPNFPIRVYA